MHEDKAGTGQQPASQSVAEFRTDAGSKGASEDIPADLLHAFENNYHSHARAWKRLAIVAIVAVGAGMAGWLLLKVRAPHQTSVAGKPAVQAPVVTPAKQKPAAVVADKARQKPGLAAASASTLPSFIPINGRDRSFSARKPGWERYVDKTREFRVFRSDGRIKAVQVLAGARNSISDSFLKTVLKEMTGKDEFAISSREQKQDFLIQRGNASQKASLLVYRNKASGAMRAFVVSLN
jgi:flagellar FliL protein